MLDRIALIIAIIGGLNWGSIGFSNSTLSHGSAAVRARLPLVLYIP